MRVLVITPPAGEIVTTADAKAHLNVDRAVEDALIAGYVKAAVQHIDGPDGWLGRALKTQTLEARLDSFAEAIALPCPPIISLTSVKYIDGLGVEATMPSANYELLGAELHLITGARWPNARWQREAVRVRYQAGYTELPAPIRAAILLMVGDLYAQRETFVTGTISSSIPMSTRVDDLLAPYRLYR